MTTLFLAAGISANCELLGIQGQRPVASNLARAVRLGFPSTRSINLCRGRFCRGRSAKSLCARQSTNQGSVGDEVKSPEVKGSPKCVAILYSSAWLSLVFYRFF